MGCSTSSHQDVAKSSSDLHKGIRTEIVALRATNFGLRLTSAGTNTSFDFGRAGALGWAGRADSGVLSSPSARTSSSSSSGESRRDQSREYQAKLQFLAAVPLMKRLPKDQHPLVASVCRSEDFAAGAAVITQGEAGDAFYIVRKGEARIHVTDEAGVDRPLALLKAGDHFGESALLRDEPRAATVVAETALQTFTIKRQQFQDLGLNGKLRFANRAAVMGGKQKPSKAKEPTPKTPEEYRFLAKALKLNEHFQAVVHLAEEKAKRLIDVMWSEVAVEGQEIITKDSLDADYFYIVREGLFEVFAQDDLRPGELKRVKTIGRLGSFGESALLYLTPRNATVVCKERGLLWVVDRQHFKQILLETSDGKQKRYMGFLDKVSFLDPLSKFEKEQLSESLVEMHFVKGESVITQGDLGSCFYIMYDGEVSIIKDGVEVEKMQARESKLQYFGESLLEDNRRAATVKVVSDKAKLLVVDIDTFTLLIGPLKDILVEHRARACSRSCRASRLADSSREYGLIKLQDLLKVGDMIYKDSSRVELWVQKASGRTYGLKRVYRSRIVTAGIQDCVLNEKEVMMMTNSPFIQTLHETYMSNVSLSFLLEPCLGGNLHSVYLAKGFHGSQRHAKFYVACATLALEHLHERRAIHRDLKPENLMLDSWGHVKLSDFGLAKFIVGKTYTTCGTPDYMAPEVISGEGHNRAVDWWATGVLLFELMAGYPPFEDVDLLRTSHKVTLGIDCVKFHPKCEGVLGDLIKALMRPKPKERLPMSEGGAEKVKAHSWYEGFDWERMEDSALPPPYVPVLRGNKDLANFSPDERDKPVDVEYEEGDASWSDGFATA